MTVPSPSPAPTPSCPAPAPAASAPSVSGRSSSREDELVELVDGAGDFAGTATVLDAHEAPGMLHRAFSVFLRRPDGRVLLQQRAVVKTRFPLRWGNTCCGHPVPGEEVVISAGRRLREELDVAGVTLREVGVYVYFAEDPATGRVEREYDHVLLGDLPDGTEIRPDPEEVAELRWVTVTELLADLGASPAAYAPWLEGVTRRLAAHLGQRTATSGNPPAQSAAERSGGK
jgi:isopentenyl-diphosphate delta-isomerase